LKTLPRKFFTILFFTSFIFQNTQSQDLFEEIDALEDTLDDDNIGSGINENLPPLDTPPTESFNSLDSLPIENTNNNLDSLPIENSAAPTLDALPMDTTYESPLEDSAPTQALTGVNLENAATLESINFRQLPDRARLIIKTNRAVDFEKEARIYRQQLILNLRNTVIREKNLTRSLDTGEFQGPVAIVKAYNSNIGSIPGARILFQLREFVEATITRKDNYLLVDFPLFSSSSEFAGKKQNKEIILPETFLSFNGTQVFYGKKITFKAKDAPIADVLDFLANASGKNFVLAQDTKSKVTINVKNVAWDQVFSMILLNSNLGYQKIGNTYRILSIQSLRTELSEAAQANEDEEKILPKITKMFHLNYAKAENVAPSLAPYLNKEQKETVVADNRTNSVVVSGTKTTLQKIEQYISGIDFQTPQVHIEARIVEATRNFAQNLGIEWSMDLGSNGAQLRMGNGSINGGSSTATGFAGGAGNFSFGQLGSFGHILSLLKIGESEKKTRTVASPFVTVSNNKTANLTQGNQFTILAPASTGSDDRSQIVTVNADLNLEVTPQVTKDRNVLLDISLTRNSPSEAPLSVSAATVPVSRREIKTEILVPSGKTAVIGGLHTKDNQRADLGWPYLKRIPILGRLFTNEDSRNDDELELLMFISPKILNAYDLGSPSQRRTASIEDDFSSSEDAEF